MLKKFFLSIKNKFWKKANTAITIGARTIIAKSAQVDTPYGGTITIGKNCSIGDYSMLLTYGGNIIIGDDCSVNPFCVLYGHGNLTIGDKVRIATHTVIIPANHTFTDVDIPIMDQEESRKGIVIEEDVWIGNGVRILDGVTIGKGSVIAAGCVVTKDVPSYSVFAGVPGKLIKKRK